MIIIDKYNDIELQVSAGAFAVVTADSIRNYRKFDRANTTFQMLKHESIGEDMAHDERWIPANCHQRNGKLRYDLGEPERQKVYDILGGLHG